MANRPTIKPCRRTQSPVTRDSNVATIRPHAVNITKYGTNRPVMTHAAAKVLKNIARNLRRSLSAALPMDLSPRRSHRRIYIQGTWSLLRLRDTPLPGPKSYRIGSNECFDSAKCRGRYCHMKSWPMPLWVKRYRFGAHRKPLNVRFTPNATELLRHREITRCANCRHQKVVCRLAGSAGRT